MSFLLRRPTALLPTSRSLLPIPRTSYVFQAQPFTQSHRFNRPASTPPDGQTISEVAKQEGGTTKGSQSAQMQSTSTRTQNLQETAADLSDKLSGDKSSLTKDDASRLQSRVDRANAAAEATEGMEPSADDAELARQAQKAASANAGETK